jgi:hypothetical protein
MDVDCDGSGRCGNSPDQKSETRWPDLVQSYSDIAGSHVDDLDANNVPYVVFGNEGTVPGYTTFDPTTYGIQPLSVMAVVCGDQMVCLPLLINMAVLTGSRSMVFGVTPTVSMLPTCLSMVSLTRVLRRRWQTSYWGNEHLPHQGLLRR